MSYMEIINLIYLIIGSPFGGIIIDILYAYFRNKTPYIKRLIAWITNKKYKVQMMGIKKYSVESFNLKVIIDLLYDEFTQIKIVSKKSNYLLVLIENMQAPYEIFFTTDEGELEIEKFNMVVEIQLIGSIDFRYRESDDNDKYIIVLNKLFDIIEMSLDKKSFYSLFTLQADLKNNFKEKPFITEQNKSDCEDTKIDIDKSIKFIKINSKTKDNLYKCLKKNVYTVL